MTDYKADVSSLDLIKLITLDESLQPFKNELFKAISTLTQDQLRTLISNWSGNYDINNQTTYFVSGMNMKLFGTGPEVGVGFLKCLNKLYLNIAIFKICRSSTISLLISEPFRCQWYCPVCHGNGSCV